MLLPHDKSAGMMEGYCDLCLYWPETGDLRRFMPWRLRQFMPSVS